MLKGFSHFGLYMKKIVIISLSVLFLAACSSSDYDNEVSTETYQENYKSDEVPQPITASTAAPLEEDVQPASALASTKVVEPVKSSDATAPKSKKVVKLSPKEEKVPTQPDPNHYLVQVAALGNEKQLLSTAADLPSNQPKWENVKTINNKKWHSLLFGNFETMADAKAAIRQLPASYQAMGPFVKSVKSITSSQYPELKKVP